MLLRGARRLVLGTLILPLGCSKPPTQQECVALLDHYVALLVKSDRPGTSDAEVLKLQAQAREKALRAPTFQQCSDEVSRGELECALRADTADRFEQCLL